MAAGRITLQDVHVTKFFYRRFIASLSDPIVEIVICTPFVGALPTPWTDIVSFCVSQQKRGVDEIRVITRPPDKGEATITADTARQLATNGVELYFRTQPYLHAKMYHFEYRKGYFRTFVGSANFTIGGFQRNHELVTEVEGVGNDTPCHREIDRLLNTGGVLSYHTWAQRRFPKGERESV